MIQGVLVSCGRGRVILEETAPIRVEILHHRIKALNQRVIGSISRDASVKKNEKHPQNK